MVRNYNTLHGTVGSHCCAVTGVVRKSQHVSCWTLDFNTALLLALHTHTQPALVLDCAVMLYDATFVRKARDLNIWLLFPSHATHLLQTLGGGSCMMDRC